MVRGPCLSTSVVMVVMVGVVVVMLVVVVVVVVTDFLRSGLQPRPYHHHPKSSPLVWPCWIPCTLNLPGAWLFQL